MDIKLSSRGLNLTSEKVAIRTTEGTVSALVLKPLDPKPHAPGVQWIHGGGLLTGMKEMVFMSRAVDMVEKFGP